MRRWAAVAGPIILWSAQAWSAQPSLSTVGDLAKQCIADDRSFCVKFIVESIDAIEADRQSRGEPLCLTDKPSQEQRIKIFVRALLMKYAYSDLSAAAAVRTIYQENCERAN
jgi:hypothetical protein